MQQQLLAARPRWPSRSSRATRRRRREGIVVTGGLEFRSVTIDPRPSTRRDVEMLEDLVLAALHDAVREGQASCNRPWALGASAGLGGLLGG